MTKNQNYIEEQEVQLELMLDKQDYLDYIDADIEAFLEVKAESLGFDVVGL